MRHHWWFPHKSHLLLLLLLPLFIHSRPTAVDFSEVTIFELNDIICICILWSYLRYITIPLFDQSYRLLSLLYKYHFELELDTHAGTLMFTELCLIEFYAHSTQNRSFRYAINFPCATLYHYYFTHESGYEVL